MPDTNILEKLRSIVGSKGWSEDPLVVSPWLTDSHGRYHGKTALFLQPGSTQEVAEVVKVCSQQGLTMVPQGGNTSRCGGATPDHSGTQILVNLARMNRIRSVDKANYSLIAEAGCILQHIHEKAEAFDRTFPLRLGAEGSCQIGGNLSTNAGGINVLRFGNTRDLVLGIEVVLADGKIWHGLRGLRKDNTGYDLKHLFIGAEGTLGIITAACLKLFPRPQQHITAICALKGLDSALEFLELSRNAAGDQLESFELIPDIAIDFALRHIQDVRFPLQQRSGWYILLEQSSPHPGEQLRTASEALLQRAFDSGLIADASIMQSEQQRQAVWFLREAVVEAQGFEGASIKHDISVPLSRIADFIHQATTAVTKICKDIRPYAFGHIGDGNIHYNLSQPIGMTSDEFMRYSEPLHQAVHEVVSQLGGSFSAEHGIGQSKRKAMRQYKEPLELQMMRAIKETLDPKNIMNPGKIF